MNGFPLQSFPLLAGLGAAQRHPPARVSRRSHLLTGGFTTATLRLFTSVRQTPFWTCPFQLRCQLSPPVPSLRMSIMFGWFIGLLALVGSVILVPTLVSPRTDTSFWITIPSRAPNGLVVRMVLLDPCSVLAMTFTVSTLMVAFPLRHECGFAPTLLRRLSRRSRCVPTHPIPTHPLTLCVDTLHGHMSASTLRKVTPFRSHWCVPTASSSLPPI